MADLRADVFDNRVIRRLVIESVDKLGPVSMPGKKSNVLRDYHLLVTRVASGFEWQIRYDRHANPVQRSESSYATQALASAAGEMALAVIRREAANPDA